MRLLRTNTRSALHRDNCPLKISLSRQLRTGNNLSERTASESMSSVRPTSRKTHQTTRVTPEVVTVCLHTSLSSSCSKALQLDRLISVRLWPNIYTCIKTQHIYIYIGIKKAFYLGRIDGIGCLEKQIFNFSV